MPSILFVCTANLTRSPMASALFRQQVEQSHTAGQWRIESAGLWAREGQPPIEEAQQVMHEMGLDIGDHRSRRVSAPLAQSFNLVLTMERGQKEALRAAFPEIANRVHLLSEMAGYAYNIADPTGGPLSGFRGTAREIDRLLAEGFDQIVRLAQRSGPASLAI